MKPRRWPVLTGEDRAAVARVLDRGVLSGAGAPEMRALEAEFAAAVGARFCLATNSGTSALHVALAAAGVGPGDEVIVPALGFIATAQAVLHADATPVFADVDPATYNIDVADAARRVSPRTRAIVPVHLHGLPADMDGIAALGRRAGLTVVEDAAQAHGALYKGRAVGTLGAMGAFSLNSTKNLPAGEGGLFVTESEELYARAARVRFDGLEPPSKWDASHPLDDEADGHATVRGWMYLPGELTAALARSQLQRLAETTARSQRNATRLGERLGRLSGVEPPVVPGDRTHVFHKYRVRLDPPRAVQVAGGIDQPERTAAPGRVQLDPVACHPGHAVRDRCSVTEQTVHQRRLPDVREADDGNGPLHAGGIATRGRPCSCVVTRNSHSRRSSAWISRDAAR